MKPFIIPLFIPHLGCKQQCSFCNQRTLTGSAKALSIAEAERIIEEQLSWPRKHPEQPVEIAFYGGSFTALEPSRQQIFLELAQQYVLQGKVGSIRLSTRPDCLEQQQINLLRRYAVQTVEIGVQSMDEKVLRLTRRGHSAVEVRAARERLKENSIACAFQLLLGLPGEDWFSWLKTIEAVCACKPEFARIYPAVVLQGTEMAEQYLKHEYSPLTLQEAVSRAAYAKNALQEAGIKVIRVGLQDSDELRSKENLLAGPLHPAFGELVESRIYQEKLSSLCVKHRRSYGYIKKMELYHNKKDCSQLKGLKNALLEQLQKQYNIGKIIMYEAKVLRGQVFLKIDGHSYVINKKIRQKCQIGGINYEQ